MANTAIMGMAVRFMLLPVLNNESDLTVSDDIPTEPTSAPIAKR
jgi:hypothetical protein